MLKGAAICWNPSLPWQPQEWEEHTREGELALHLSTDAVTDDVEVGGSEALAEIGLLFSNAQARESGSCL